jgi:uncharacterized protein
VSLASALYVGWVRHRRVSPRREFTYPVFMTYLDLGELERVFAGRWLWSTSRAALARFDRRDHLGDPSRPLDECVRDLVAERTGCRPRGPVRLLTNLRMFGVAFNPVSFFYCFDEAGERVECIVAEVSNTPWNERHHHVLDHRGRRDPLTFEVAKELHVSPFLGMDLTHRFRFSPPGGRLVAHIEDHGPDGRVLDATLSLARRPIGGRALAATLARHPFMTLEVLAAIYTQALRLWLRGVPYHPHPRDRAAARAEGVA